MRIAAAHVLRMSACLSSLAFTLAACAGKAPGGDAAASGDAAGTTSEETATGSGGESTTSGATAAPTGGPADPTTGLPDTESGDGPGDGELVCPASIDQAILGCIAALQDDPELGEKVFLLDMVMMCSDAEPVADDYDAHCAAQPGDPICALEYRTFVEDVLPACVARVQQVVFADVCLLPTSYAEWLFVPGVALMERRFVTDAAELDPTEQQQVVWASADMGFPAGSADEALLATDDDGVEQLTVLDVGTDRVLVLYTAHYGDTRVGRLFFQGTLTVVGAVEDGLFGRCGVERAIEGRPCEEDMSCGPEFMCVGPLVEQDVVVAPGACVSTAAEPPAPLACVFHADCAPSVGLLCLDNPEGGEAGRCRPGWMRRSFAGPDTALVAGGSVEVPIVASGLATVPTAGYLDLQIAQDVENELAIRLVNPMGTSKPVVTTDVPLLRFDLEPVAVQTDESAGGVWRLVVEDIGGAASGTVGRVALTLDSRWD